MKLEGRTVLITGAGGFMGLHLARTLIQGGARVVGAGLETPSSRVPFDWHSVDVRDLNQMGALVQAAKPDATVHLAGQSSAARSFSHPVETFEINLRGVWNLLEATRREAPRARVLVVASGEVYGALPEGTRATEDLPFRPVNPYGLSKAAADALSEGFACVYGLDVIRARSFNHSGPGQDDRFALPSFARQIAAIEKGLGEAVLKVGNLQVTRDLTDVRDIAVGYQALLERGRPGAAYNLCRGEGVRLDRVVQQMIKLSRVVIRVESDPERIRPADIPWLVGDPSAIERDTGWRAETPLERTLLDLLEDARLRS